MSDLRVDVHFSPVELEPAALADRTVVVLDVLRATTTIVEALANGAVAVIPTGSTEDAVRLVQSLGRDDALLCGERKGRKIEGFDLGNSPAEYVPERVAGKKLVMNTTNGTRALLVAEEAAEVLVGAFTNLSAVADTAAGSDAVTILCAGREGRFALEDAVCAGHLVRALEGRTEGDPVYTDAARAARALAEVVEPGRAFLETTAAGRSLLELGMGDDLDLCVELDRHRIVPTMREQSIVLP